MVVVKNEWRIEVQRNHRLCDSSSLCSNNSRAIASRTLVT